MAIGSKNTNMSEGRPLKLLAAFALPLFIGNLFQQAYNLADSIIVGRFLGAGALAAVGATGSLSFLFFSVCNGISSGGGIVVAQSFGGGDMDRVRRAIANSAYIMIVSCMTMSALSFALAPALLRLIGTPEDIMADAMTYMRMNCIGVLMVGLYNYAASMLRALGDSRTPLYFLVVSCLLNVALDVLCVRVLNLGVMGAALATMLAQLIAGTGCLMFAIRSNPCFTISREQRAFDAGITLRAVRLGLPLAMQWSMIAVSTTMLQSVVNSFGTTAVASFTATNRIEQLVQQPFGSLGMALSTFSGQNLGAGRPHRVREGFHDGMLAMFAFACGMTLIMQLLGGTIIRAFVEDADVIAMGGRALRMTSWFYFCLGTIYITRGVLNGVGDALFSLINGGIEVLCRILLPMGLMLIPGVGVWAIWWTAGLTWVISGLSCIMRYLAWTHRHLPRVQNSKVIHSVDLA